MVRERLDTYWISLLYALFEHEPNLTDKDVADQMALKGHEESRHDFPAPRTVNKYRRIYHMRMKT